MAFTSPMTAVTGATFTAAQFNTHVRDNENAIWVVTTAGDIQYATGATTQTRLAIGTAYQFLQVNAGATAPAWGGLQWAQIYNSGTQNVNTASATALSFDAETSDVPGWHAGGAPTRMTIGVTGYYQAGVSFAYGTTGGSGTYWDAVQLYRNGSVVMEDRRYQERSVVAKWFSVVFAPFQVSATEYLEIYLEQNSGATATVAAAPRFWVWRFA